MFADEREKQGFANRLAVYYGAIFVIYGIQLPYLPVWLDWRGLSATDIGLVSALPLVARIVLTPLIAMAADRTAGHRTAVILLAWLGVIAAALLGWSSTVLATGAVVFVLLIATYTAMPLAESIAMAGVRAGALDYGRMRLWGSVTFIVANVAGGLLVAVYGTAVVAYGLLAGALMTVAGAHLLPVVARGAATQQRQPTLAAARRLVTNPAFLLLVTAAGAIQASHAVFYAFGVLHWRENGLSAGWTGALWAIGVLVEVGLLAISGRAVAVLGARGLLMVGGAAGVVRWAIMALDPPLAVLVPLQTLHAATFAATHIGTVHIAQTLAPKGTEGTSQAILSAVTAGIAMGGAMALSGPLYTHVGAASYLAMAALAAAGLAAAALLAPVVQPEADR
ncbi:MAG: MFS transporter [Hyphomicrobiaceae bacterium]